MVKDLDFFRLLSDLYFLGPRAPGKGQGTVVYVIQRLFDVKEIYWGFACDLDESKVQQQCSPATLGLMIAGKLWLGSVTVTFGKNRLAQVWSENYCLSERAFQRVWTRTCNFRRLYIHIEAIVQQIFKD